MDNAPIFLVHVINGLFPKFNMFVNILSIHSENNASMFLYIGLMNLVLNESNNKRQKIYYCYLQSKFCNVIEN